jgi:hypothetical protein
MGIISSKNKSINEEIIFILTKCGFINHITYIILEYYFEFKGNIIYHNKISHCSNILPPTVKILSTNNNKIRFVTSSTHKYSSFYGDAEKSYINFMIINENELPKKKQNIDHVIKYEYNFSLELKSGIVDFYIVSELYNENYPEGCCVIVVKREENTYIEIWDLLSKSMKGKLGSFCDINNIHFLTKNLIICFCSDVKSMIIDINNFQIVNNTNNFVFSPLIFLENNKYATLSYVYHSSYPDVELQIWDKNIINNKCIKSWTYTPYINSFNHIPILLKCPVNKYNNEKIILCIKNSLYIYDINSDPVIIKEFKITNNILNAECLSYTHIIINDSRHNIFIFNIDSGKIDFKADIYDKITHIIIMSEYSFITFMNSGDVYHWNYLYNSYTLFKYHKIESMKYLGYIKYDKKDNYIITGCTNGDIFIYY